MFSLKQGGMFNSDPSLTNLGTFDILYIDLSFFKKEALDEQARLDRISQRKDQKQEMMQGTA